MTAPAPSPTRRSRWRPGRRLTAVALVLLAGIALAVLFRTELATRAATAYLRGQGVPVQSLTVARLALGGIEVQDVRLGRQEELTIKRLQLTPRLEGLRPTLASAQVDGLQLRIDLRDGAPVLGSLQPAVDRLVAGATGTEAAPPGSTALPSVTLHDARLVFETPSGPMTAKLAGGLASAQDGALRADFALDLDSALGHAKAQLTGRRSSDGALSLTAKVEDGRLAWQGFAAAQFSGLLSASQSGPAGPRLDADLKLHGLSYTPKSGAPLEIAKGTLTAKGGPSDARVSLDLDGGPEAVKLDAAVSRSSAEERQHIDLSIEGEARTSGGLAQFLPLPGPGVTSGTARLSANGTVDLPGGAVPRSWEDLRKLLPDSRAKLTGDARLAEVALADGSQGISTDLPLIAELDGQRLTLTLSKDSIVRIAQPSADGLHRLGVPDNLRPLVGSGLTVTLDSAGSLPFRVVATPAWPPRRLDLAVSAQATGSQGLTLTAGAKGGAELGDGFAVSSLSGEADTAVKVQHITFGGLAAQDLSLALPLSATFGDAGLRMKLARAGHLHLGQLEKGAPLRLQQPLDVSVPNLAIDAPADASHYSYDLHATATDIGLQIVRTGASPLAVRTGSAVLELKGSSDDKAAMNVRVDGLAVPDYHFAAEKTEVAVTLDGKLRPLSSRFSMAPFQLGGTEPLTAPLRLAGELKRAGAGYDATTTLALDKGADLADLNARYGDNGKARIAVASKRLDFSPDGLQPAQISPRLAVLQEVKGSLQAKATLAWPLDAAKESGQITLDNLSFKSHSTTVNGLNLALSLDRLVPLSSAKTQHLTIAEVDAGVPVEAIDLAFSLDQTPRPQLAVESGAFDLGGGRWRIEPVVLDPAAARNRIVLATDGLDMAALFNLMDVNGLSGSGTLKGSIPIVFQGKDVIVDNGRFEALGPGKLSIRLEALRSALAGGGETVAMAAKALEDFHYDTLSLTLAKTADNDATLKLSTLGQNPAVMNGQPFRFNINLESNLTSILEALQQGYSLSDEALRRAWSLHQ